MSDLCTTLDRLILAAQAVLTLRSPGEPDYLTQLGADLNAWHAKPAPDGRVVHNYTVLMMAALFDAGAAVRSHGASHAQPYFRVIGTLLPDVRADYAIALEMRRRPTA